METTKRFGLVAKLIFLFIFSSLVWQASQAEVMSDACSQAVAFPLAYDGKPGDPGTVIFRRETAGWSPWSEPFSVKLGKDGHIRWWCNSTNGNLFDAGTWKPNVVNVGVGCNVNNLARVILPPGVADYQCAKTFFLRRSDLDGWTPERSRCNDRSNVVQVRIGPNRAFEITCTGRQQAVASAGTHASDIEQMRRSAAIPRRPTDSSRVQSTARPLSASASSPQTCQKAVQGKIAWDYKGNKSWGASNLNKLCAGAKTSDQPARCFQRVMHGNLNWGGGTRWEWENALKLCQGADNADHRINCFIHQRNRGKPWADAINECKQR